MTDKPSLELLIAAPRGFCAGVDRAIRNVELAIEKHGAPVYVRHEIVHNRIVVERFRERGVVFVDSIDEVPPGRPIMLSAHGSAPEVVAAARELGKPAAAIKVTIRPLAKFWTAEGYHQNYAKRNGVRYNYYRWSCGRDRRLDTVWGRRARTSQRWQGS
jgi:hypothetical protein